MRTIAAVLGVLAALALCAGGGVLAYDAADSLIDGARHGETRTPIPGATDVELDEGKYVVFYEVDSTSVGDENVPVPEFTLTIRRAGGGPPLKIEDYGSDFRVDSGGRVGQAVSTVRIPSDGRYRIRTTGTPVGDEPAVVLGKPVGRRVLRLVLGATLFVAGLAIGLLVVGDRRRPRLSQPARGRPALAPRALRGIRVHRQPLRPRGARVHVDLHRVREARAESARAIEQQPGDPERLVLREVAGAAPAGRAAVELHEARRGACERLVRVPGEQHERAPSAARAPAPPPRSP